MTTVYTDAEGHVRLLRTARSVQRARRQVRVDGAGSVVRDAPDPDQPHIWRLLDITSSEPNEWHWVDHDPVGITEIAERLGVARATVDQWRTRNLLPEPSWTVGGRPAWNWPDVESWAQETGRL